MLMITSRLEDPDWTHQMESNLWHIWRSTWTVLLLKQLAYWQRLVLETEAQVVEGEKDERRIVNATTVMSKDTTLHIALI